MRAPCARYVDELEAKLRDYEHLQSSGQAGEQQTIALVASESMLPADGTNELGALPAVDVQLPHQSSAPGGADAEGLTTSINASLMDQPNPTGPARETDVVCFPRV